MTGLRVLPASGVARSRQLVRFHGTAIDVLDHCDAHHEVRDGPEQRGAEEREEEEWEGELLGVGTLKAA
jgi:hypothetical protein